MDLSPIAISPTVSQAAAQTPPTAEQLAKRASIKQAAQDFEASFLQVMFGEMFSSVQTPAIGGGGAGEEAFKSFMTEAMAKQVAKHGGVGLAASVQKEMLKLQGLS